MKKTVRVKVRSSQQYDDYSDQISSNSIGEYQVSRNVHTIDYVEKTEGDNIICNSLILKKDSAMLIRSGAVTSQMTFDKGKTKDMEYHTDYGRMNFKINTLGYNVVIEEKHIKVLIQYDLIHNCEKVSKNTLQIAIDFE